MDIRLIINQVVILLLIIIAGFYGRRKGYIDNRVNKGLTDIMLNITLPLMIIASFNVPFNRSMLLNTTKLFLVSVLVHVFSIAIGKLLFYRMEPGARKVLEFSAVFSSCGLVGFPVMESLYGKQAIFYGSVYLLVFNLFLWTYGSFIFNPLRDMRTLKRALLNPGLGAVFTGLVLFISPIRFPWAVSRAMETLGAMTTPLSMIIIGSMLGAMDIRKVFSGFDAYYSAFVRLVLIPGATIFLLRLAGFEGILLGAVVLSVSAPTAAVTVVFAERYGGDTGLASRCVLVSTVLYILTVPLLGLFL